MLLAKYDSIVKVGMAAWVEDDPWNIWGGFPSGTKESFWSNLPLALAYSDEYVWVWSEQTRYGQDSNAGLNPFLASLRNQTFNTGHESVATLTEDFTTDPLTRGWHFDFDMLAIGKKKDPADAVPLMSVDTVPYVWERSEKEVRVRGEASSCLRGQRRRYVHPVQPLSGNQSFRVALDFSVDAFGDRLDNPVVLGLFSSERPIQRGSLTLQIAGPDQVRVVVAGNGEPRTLQLTITGGLKTGRIYRLAFDFDGPTDRVTTVLSEPASESSPVAQIQVSVGAARGAFAWDELGIALWEDSPTRMPPEVAYHYRLKKVTFDR